MRDVETFEHIPLRFILQERTNKLMDKIPQRDKPSEGTSKSTAKAGPRPWEISPYTYQEEPENSKRLSHGDPRLESHGQHLDSDFIPHDGDHEALHPAFGLGTTHDLSARASSAGDQGTLAGWNEEAYDHYRKIQRVAEDYHKTLNPAPVYAKLTDKAEIRKRQVYQNLLKKEQRWFDRAFNKGQQY
jgi:hypothetical protein